MKTILLVFFLSGFGLCAQTPAAPADDADAAARDAALRQALRSALIGRTNAPAAASVAPPITFTPTPAPAPTIVAPAATPAVPVAAVPGTPVVSTTTTTTSSSTTTKAATPLGNVTNTVTTPPVVTLSTNVASAPKFPAFPAFPAAPGAPVNPNANATTSHRGRTRNGPGNTPNIAMPAAPAGSKTTPTVADATNATPAETVLPAGVIDFPSVSLDQVLPIYAELVGRTILRGQLPAVQISLKTETPLTKTEAIEAFDTVLAMNNITMINVGDKFVKAVPSTQAFQQAAPFNTNESDTLPEADQYMTEIVQLKYNKPSDLLPALTPLAQIPNSIIPIENSGILIIRDYSSNIKRMMELINKIDITAPSEFDSEVIPIKYAQASDIASALSSLGGSSGTTIGKSSAVGSGAGGSRTGSGFGSGSGTLGGYGGAAGGLNGGGGFGGAGAGGARTSSFNDRLNQIVSKAAGGGKGDFDILGQTKIIADQRTNSLLVFASKQDMAMIKKIIGELDIVLAQVLIEAIIMEVSLDRGNTVAASYLQNNPSTPGNYFTGIGGINNGTFLNPGSFASVGTNVAAAIPSGFSYFANFGSDFQATLTAIANDSRITVLSRPRIQTSHGVKAELQVGDTVPEVTGTYFGGLTGGTASSQYQQTFVGIDLQVTPLINPDGLVVMDIAQDVEQLGTPTTIDGNPVPTTSKRTATATVSVRDRDTIILGGMISTSKSTTRAGVPFLKDIPVLGYLFRSTSDDNTRKELIVLIRPTVLPTPEAAALTATHEVNKMPAVKQAEADQKREEIRRQKAAADIKVEDDN